MGLVGGGWKYKQLEVQSYCYFSSDVHSYPLQIFMENGILAIIAFIGIITYIIFISSKAIKKRNDIYFLSIICGIIVLLVHSMIDFDLSFMYNLVILFIGMAILSSYVIEDKKQKKEKIISNIIIICICIALLIINSSDFILERSNKISKINSYNKSVREKYIQYPKKENLDVLNTLFENEKGNREKYAVEISNIIKKYENEEVIVKNIYENIKYNKYSVSPIYSIERSSNLIEIANNLLRSNNKNVIKYSTKFAKLVLEEYNKNVELLSNKDKNRMQESEIKKYEKILEDNKNRAKIILKEEINE